MWACPTPTPSTTSKSPNLTTWVSFNLYFQELAKSLKNNLKCLIFSLTLHLMGLFVCSMMHNPLRGCLSWPLLFLGFSSSQTWSTSTSPRCARWVLLCILQLLRGRKYSRGWTTTCLYLAPNVYSKFFSFSFFSSMRITFLPHFLPPLSSSVSTMVPAVSQLFPEQLWTTPTPSVLATHATLSLSLSLCFVIFINTISKSPSWLLIVFLWRLTGPVLLLLTDDPSGAARDGWEVSSMGGVHGFFPTRLQSNISVVNEGRMRRRRRRRRNLKN